MESTMSMKESIVLIIYLLPTIIALFGKRVKFIWCIFILNLLSGWVLWHFNTITWISTLIWAGALTWAILMKKGKKE